MEGYGGPQGPAGIIQINSTSRIRLGAYGISLGYRLCAESPVLQGGEDVNRAPISTPPHRAANTAELQEVRAALFYLETKHVRLIVLNAEIIYGIR
jgi:hypothetical protein